MTEEPGIVYNGFMKMVRILLAWILLGTGVVALASQPPAEEKRAERRGSETNQGVPLDKLPVPENGVIVVTPDLKKALDSLGAGSVVLSAQTYAEMKKQIEKANKPDKSTGEILFARCQIQGEVKTVAGREVAELTFELEFRTETPQTFIPIPFKGLRMSGATLNGGPPIWGPDPEKWSLLIKEPQACKLKLTTTVPVSRVGQEKRLSLERVPSSAITSLELTVPGTVPGAMVPGYGSVTAQPAAGKTLLSAPALGVLTSLDLTWQSGEVTTATTAPTLEGDIRLTAEESQMVIDSRLKPVPFVPIQLPWKVRLPKNSQQVKAELQRGEAGTSETLLVTRQADGLYLLNAPYAINALAFTHISIRWKQPLPEAETAEATLIGSCEVIEPAGREQAGTVTLTLPEEAPAMFRPKHMTPMEKVMLPGDRENRRVLRYRYQQQPAGLEATALPQALLRGVIETRLQHAISALDGGWLLTTEVDVVRSARSNLAQLEFAWPAEWPVSRKLLFSPLVKEIEQDTKSERLRIILDGRQAASLSLKLESLLANTSNRASLKVPQLLSASGLQQGRLTPMDVLVSRETVRLEAGGSNTLVESNQMGLKEEATEAQGRQFQVTGRPAQIVLTKLPRLPRWVSQVEVFVGKETLLTRQTMEIRWLGQSKRSVSVLVPRGVKKAQFFRKPAEGQAMETLAATASVEPEGSPWTRWTIELSAGLERSTILVCQCEQESTHPITVPLARLEETAATQEEPMLVRCIMEAGIKLALPADLPGWQTVRQERGTLELQSTSPQSLLALNRQDTAQVPELHGRQSTLQVEDSGAFCLMELETRLIDLSSCTLTLQSNQAMEDVTLLGWKLDGRLMPAHSARSLGGSNLVAWQFALPVDRLHTSATVQVAVRCKRGGSNYWRTYPALYWQQGIEGLPLMPVTWKVRGEPTQWLWWSSERVDESRHGDQSWFPVSPVAATDVSTVWYTLQSAGGLEPLTVLLIPRSISWIVLSCLSLAVIRTLSNRPRLLSKLGWIVGLSLLVLYLAQSGLATALVWGAMPGIILALVLVAYEYHWQHRKSARPPVFRSGGAATSTSTVVRPSRAAGTMEAQTIISSPGGVR